MKPFLFLGIRAEDAAADDEYAAVLRCAGLDERDLRRHRLERDELGHVDLDEWSGIVLGGGPFNISDPASVKSPEQRRAEAEMRALALEAVAADFPFFGACYGIGTLGTLEGGLVDRQWSEPIGSVTIALTEDGQKDPLFGGLPESFDVFLGHKEAVTRCPAAPCCSPRRRPARCRRSGCGSNVYATQFHPELDVESLCLRIEIYRDYGYFDPARGRGADADGPRRRRHRAAPAAGPVRRAVRP